MSDSPFLPPQDASDDEVGTWGFLAARIATAVGVVAYSLVLLALGGRSLWVVVQTPAGSGMPVEAYLPNVLALVALCLAGIVGVGSATVHVLFRNLALRALLVFAAVAWIGVFPLALVSAIVGESPSAAARIVAVGSLGPMLCLMAYGGLLTLQPRAKSANDAVGS